MKGKDLFLGLCYVDRRFIDEAETVTDEYVAFCIETIEAVRLSCPDPLIMVEHRLDYSDYHRHRECCIHSHREPRRGEIQIR